MTPAALAAYLDRIGWGGPLAATAEGVAALQAAHRRAIAFENLDIRLGRPLSLEPEALFAKLVTARRGGYCFEQNGFFLDVLRQLGLEARPVLGRVWLARPESPPARSHTLNLVRIGGREFLSDVGFGGSLAPLMALEDGVTAVAADGSRHALARDPAHGWMLSREGAPQYSFSEEAVWPADLLMANHFTETWAGSRFVRAVLASRPGPDDGLVTLTDRRLSFPGGEAAVADADAYRAALAEHMGISLTPAEVARLGLFS